MYSKIKQIIMSIDILNNEIIETKINIKNIKIKTEIVTNG